MPQSISDVLILDPSVDDLSRPSCMRELMDEFGASIALWLDEKESSAGQNYLRYKAGLAQRHRARDCEVVFLDTPSANAFMDEHHLQGSSNASIHVGLCKNKTIVACMSFNVPSACRSRDAHFLLQRFATKGSVAGAASRLFKAFRTKHAGSIITYSDNRYSPYGTLYKFLGFSCLRCLRPDYRYWREGKWFAKNRKQKKHLLAEGASPGTEAKMAQELGYTRCYDLGKRTWFIPEIII